MLSIIREWTLQRLSINLWCRIIVSLSKRAHKWNNDNINEFRDNLIAGVIKTFNELRSSLVGLTLVNMGMRSRGQT